MDGCGFPHCHLSEISSLEYGVKLYQIKKDIPYVVENT